MSISRFAVFLVAFLLITSPAFSQTKKFVDSNAMEKMMQKQRILRAGKELAPTLSRGRNAAGWTDISAAPDFPIPLFHGNQTKFMKLSSGASATLEAAINKYGRQITLMTKDSPLTVYQWYVKYLPSSGYKIDDKFPKRAPASKAYLLRGNGAKSLAMITIAAKDDPTGPGSQINITVGNKPLELTKK